MDWNHFLEVVASTLLTIGIVSVLSSTIVFLIFVVHGWTITYRADRILRKEKIEAEKGNVRGG